MTALKPIENRIVRGVASERYPLNALCAHPECWEPAVDPHHIFPRSMIGGDSWFVEIAGAFVQSEPQPHVTGLCRPHHDDVEQHRAWIKLEDGHFVWWDVGRIPDDELSRWEEATGEHRDSYPFDHFIELGLLDPQPCKGEKKARHKPDTRPPRKRKTITLRVPIDAEDGAALFDESLGQCKDRLFQLEAFADRERLPNYEALMAVMRDWLDTQQNTAWWRRLVSSHHGLPQPDVLVGDTCPVCAEAGFNPREEIA